MKTIKTGIIGCGKVAAIHARALAGLPQSAFTAVYSRDSGKARAFADRYQVKACSSLDDFIASGVEAVCICTPHPDHRAAALAMAAAGVHILVEKPLAASLRDCDDILAAAAKHEVTVGTVCQRRFFPPCLRIRDAIDAGKIGRPMIGTVYMLGWRDESYYRSDPWRGRWCEEGGGVLVNQAPHQLDLLQWYMGPIDELSGYWANLNHPYIEVEDTAAAIIRFKSGALGSIVVSNSVNPALYGKVHIFGDNGAAAGVQTDGGAMFIAGLTGMSEPPVNDLWTIAGEEDMLPRWVKSDTDFFNSIDPVTYFHQQQIDDFLKAVIAGRKPLIDGYEGRKTVEIFTAIYRSNRDKKPVRFPLEPEADAGFDGRL